MINLFYLILASILAATSWANSNFPLVFFAKIEDTYVPLSGKYLGDDHSGMSLLSHGNRFAKPVEFTLEENRIYTKQGSAKMFVGFSNNGLVFGPSVTPTTLNFDNERRVLKGPYNSCDVFNNQVRGIMNKHSNVPSKYCFKVELYFLPYDKAAKSAVEPFPPVPLAFCAKINGTLKPLFPAIHLGEHFEDSRMLAYGDKYDHTPAKFTILDNHVFTYQKSYGEYMNMERLEFGTKVASTSLKLNSKWQVINGPYYACDLMNSQARGIYPAAINESCSKVEIYLLPHDEVTFPNSDHIPISMPWHLFAKFNNTFMPLSGSYIGEQFKDFKVFTYGDPSTPPVKFTLKDGRIYTKQISEWEFAGFHEGFFVFGSTPYPATLNLDRSWRILNGPFHSCDFRDLVDDGVRGILQGLLPTTVDCCFKVEVYFLPYDRVMGRPARNIPPPSSLSSLSVRMYQLIHRN